jgi:HlyD family secretion protein
MHGPRRFLIPLFLILILAVAGGWYLLQARAVQGSGSLSASGTVESVEVAVAPEVGGRVVEVLAEEGSSVEPGQVLFRLDDELLQVQRARAEAALETARANRENARQAVEMAKAGLKLAQTGLENARTGVEAAEVQVQAALQAAHAADRLARAEAWKNDIPTEFSQPVWYFGKDEEIESAQAELAAAQEDLEIERENFKDVLGQSGTEKLQEAEKRLSDAQAAFLVAQGVQDRAEAQSDQEIRDYAQMLFDAASSELEAAQAEYDRLLSSESSAEVLEARARLAVAEERYQAARDLLDGLLTGDRSLQVRAAEVARRQAEGAAAQAEAGVAQAEVAVDQAEAAQAQADKAIAQAETELVWIDAQLGKYTVRASTSGTVTSQPVEAGEVVQPGSPILMLSQLDHLTITVYLTEDRYGQVRLGERARVTVDSFPGDSFEGRVVRIADRAEYTPRNVQTEEGRRTTVFAVEIALENPEGRLKPGMPADVVFEK